MASALMLSKSNIQTASRNGVAKTEPHEAVISRRRIRSDLTDPGLEHSTDVCPEHGVAKKLKIEHRKLKR